VNGRDNIRITIDIYITIYHSIPIRSTVLRIIVNCYRILYYRVHAEEYRIIDKNRDFRYL